MPGVKIAPLWTAGNQESALPSSERLDLHLPDSNATLLVHPWEACIWDTQIFLFPSSLLLLQDQRASCSTSSKQDTMIGYETPCSQLARLACTLVCKELLEFRKGKQKNIQNFISVKFGFKRLLSCHSLGQKRNAIFETQDWISLFHIPVWLSPPGQKPCGLAITQRVPWRRNWLLRE